MIVSQKLVWYIRQFTENETETKTETIACTSNNITHLRILESLHIHKQKTHLK